MTDEISHQNLSNDQNNISMASITGWTVSNLLSIPTPRSCKCLSIFIADSELFPLSSLYQIALLTVSKCVVTLTR